MARSERGEGITPIRFKKRSLKHKVTILNIHHFLITRTAFFLVQQKFKQLMKLQQHFSFNAIFHLQVFEISLESAIVHAYQCLKLSDIDILIFFVLLFFFSNI